MTLKPSPSATPHVLLLGGSAEGYALAEQLTAQGLHVLTSFAGATSDRRPPAGAHRVGGFGGAQGLASALVALNRPLLLDATHPYASAMSAHAHEAAQTAGVPHAHLWRPAWEPGAGDDWQTVASLEEAARALPAGARAFLTTGRQGVAAFAGRDDVDFWLRCVDRPAPPVPARLTVLRDKGPFRLADERALIARTAATHLVTKNSGGPAPKLIAAREAGLRVVMVARPLPPKGPLLDSVETALAWTLDQMSRRSVSASAPGA